MPELPNNRSAIIQSSWLDPRKTREMTIVGSKRMIVYDDVAPIEKIRIYDARVERPPHYDTFGEFHYAYHYGDMYVPYIKQEEPLRSECQHFLDCIRDGITPLTDGNQGMELVRILEASSESLKLGGSPVQFTAGVNGVRPVRTLSGRPTRLAVPKMAAVRMNGQNGKQKHFPSADSKVRIKIQMNGNGNSLNGNGNSSESQ